MTDPDVDAVLERLEHLDAKLERLMPLADLLEHLGPLDNGEPPNLLKIIGVLTGRKGA